jgi:hypothetical protein
MIPTFTVAACWLLSATSPDLTFPSDINGFEATTLTNRAIQCGIDDSLLDAEDDPALLAFLEYLDAQMAAHPELIVEADYAQLDRIAKLVEGVELEGDD